MSLWITEAMKSETPDKGIMQNVVVQVKFILAFYQIQSSSLGSVVNYLCDPGLVA